MSDIIAMNQPLVSVIIPAYNADNLILEALTSVKEQNYLTWEIIVIEDASKDKTEQIVLEFSQTTSKHNIRYIRHEQNQGLAATRNTGIKFARGKYLAFLDHDDVWNKTHLETAVEKLESGDTDLVYSTVEKFRDGTNNSLGFWGPDKEDLDNFPNSLFLRNYIQPSSVIMKKSITETGLVFDPSLRQVEDLDYWLRLAANGYKFVHISGIHSRYRKSQSTMTANTQKMDEAVALVLRKNYDIDIISIKIKRYKLARKHLKTLLWNWKTNPLKAIKYGILAFIITPIGCLEATTIFLKEKLSNKDFDEKQLYY